MNDIHYDDDRDGGNILILVIDDGVDNTHCAGRDLI